MSFSALIAEKTAATTLALARSSTCQLWFTESVLQSCKYTAIAYVPVPTLENAAPGRDPIIFVYGLLGSRV